MSSDVDFYMESFLEEESALPVLEKALLSVSKNTRWKLEDEMEALNNIIHSMDNDETESNLEELTLNLRKLRIEINKSTREKETTVCLMTSDTIEKLEMFETHCEEKVAALEKELKSVMIYTRRLVKKMGCTNTNPIPPCKTFVLHLRQCTLFQDKME